jgi:predicted S18 family serine protease
MESCRSKVSEASERIEYIRMLTGLPLDNTQKQLDYAYDDYDNGRYELCLFKASLAKAEADILISLFGVSTNSTKDIMELKLGLARDNINKQASKGIFPILSYSYYEYAESLKDTDISSALLYVEYALELSNQEIYFKKADEKRLVVDNRVLLAASFAAGLVIGGSATLLLRKRRNASRKGK